MFVVVVACVFILYIVIITIIIVFHMMMMHIDYKNGKCLNFLCGLHIYLCQYIMNLVMFFAMVFHIQASECDTSVDKCCLFVICG